MPRKKKPIQEMNDEELKRFLFPKKVREELQRIAHEKDDPEDKDDADSPYRESSR